MENISRHLVTTRATRNDQENDKFIQISIGIYRWQWIAKAMSTRVSGKYRGISSESSDEAGDLPEWGLSRRNSYENLELELAKPFNPNRREIRVPGYRRGVKDPNTIQWRRGPVSRTAMLVKNFFQWLDSTSAKEFGRGIPTGSRHWYQLVTPRFNHTLIIHANMYDQDQGLTGRYHNTTLKIKISHPSIIIQARGLEGSNTSARS